MRKFAQLTFTILALALVSLAFSAVTEAQTATDPAIFTGNPSACPDSSCTPLYGTEVIGVNAGSVDLFLPGGTSIPSTGQLVLIIGIPNPPGGSAPDITSINGVTLGTPIAGSLAGSLTSLNSEIYNTGMGGTGVVNLPGDGSESFGNWTGADCTVLSICGVTSFGIYEYVLSGNGINGGGDLTVDFSGSGLSKGTFVVAWGCDNTSTQCSTGQHYWSTPFTHVGLVTSQVPEPGSLALLGTGLLALGGAIRRRWSNS